MAKNKIERLSEPHITIARYVVITLYLKISLYLKYNKLFLKSQEGKMIMVIYCKFHRKWTALSNLGKTKIQR